MQYLGPNMHQLSEKLLEIAPIEELVHLSHLYTISFPDANVLRVCYVSYGGRPNGVVESF